MSLRKALSIVPVLLIGSGILAGCGLLSKPANSWVGSDDTAAILLQFARDGDSLQGTLDVTQLATAEAASTDASHHGFTGVIDESRLTLTFPEGFGFTDTISGTITRSRLTLNFPDSGTGRLVTIPLTPGSTSDYQSAVDRLRNKATANAQHAEQQAAAEAAEARLTGASDAVEEDVNTLTEKLDKGLDFAPFDADLASARKALDATKAAAAKAKAEGPGSDGCYEASNARYEASNVEYGASSIDYDAQRAQSTIDEVGRLAGKLAEDYQSLLGVLRDQGQAPDTANGKVVTDLQDRAVSTAAAWRTRVADYQAKVKKLVDQATASADAAEKAVC